MTEQTIDKPRWTPPRRPSRFSALFLVSMVAVAACSFLFGLTQAGVVP